LITLRCDFFFLFLRNDTRFLYRGVLLKKTVLSVELSEKTFGYSFNKLPKDTALTSEKHF